MMTDSIEQLNDFDPAMRAQALTALAPTLTRASAPVRAVNMHCHSFFSYNGYDASPSRIVYEAAANGWEAAGLCDFDVLDGMEEFLAAGDLLQVRTAVNMETRTFFKEYADKEINSPGEPGVYYFMGGGFVKPPSAGTAAETVLQNMRAGAEQRNRDMLDRINPALDGFSLDYDADVLPLTPKGNATERHICAAFYETSKQHFSESQWVEFWTTTLGADRAAVAALYTNAPKFSDACRSKLMKSGGPGYVQPDETTFPVLDNVIDMILACNAIPMATWLDGCTPGEGNIQELLECQVAKGIAALNIVPDRNWNYSDPDVASLKIRKLRECVEAADRMGLPINIGTELNKFGQLWIDDFAGGPMPDLAPTFLRGASIMVGHTLLTRFADFSYVSAAATSEYPDLAAKNTFFAAVGALPAPAATVLDRLASGSTDSNFAILADAATKGSW